MVRASAPAKALPRIVGAFVRHFFDRFFDAEPLSPGADPQTNTVQIVGFVAVPSGLFTILCLPVVLAGWTLVAERNFFVSFSMIVIPLVIVIEWDALFPDRRDTRF